MAPMMTDLFAKFSFCDKQLGCRRLYHLSWHLQSPNASHQGGIKRAMRKQAAPDQLKTRL